MDVGPKKSMKSVMNFIYMDYDDRECFSFIKNNIGGTVYLDIRSKHIKEVTLSLELLNN